MNFPIITHIQDLSDHIEHLDEIRFMKQPNGTTVVCYMIADNDTFSGPYEQWSRECRGITFDKNDKIINRPLHKFFNVGEKPETQKDQLDWSKVTRIMMKRDGSMISPVLIDNDLVWKSKKSFESDVAILAEKYATVNDKIFSRDLCEQGFTPIFELTTPDARIVIKYPESKLTLLHVRENSTGRYLNGIELANLSMLYDIDLVKEYSFTNIEHIIEELETITNFEGYVIQFEDGNMVKLKSKWYLELHGSITNMTERNVAELVLSETLDDIISYLNEVQDDTAIKKVREIENKVVEILNDLVIYVENIYEKYKHLERKDFAIQFNKYPRFGLLMTKYLGKEPDYKEYFRKNILKENFGCTTI